MSPLTRRFWLLALAQAFHSIEEMRTGLYDFFWIATGRFHEWFPVIPQLRMSARTFAILNMGIIALLLAAVPFVSARRPWALGFAAAAAAVEIANGMGHLAGTVVFSGYVPGALTAPLLIAGGIAVLAALRTDNRRAGCGGRPAIGG